VSGPVCIAFLDNKLIELIDLTLLQNNLQVVVLQKIGSLVKCGFQRAGCEVVPMCKVPGKVRGRAVALRRSGASCFNFY